MKQLIKNTDPQTKEVLFVFEDQESGQMISNPLWNPEMTEHANPERYGFQVWNTGGGCTAHGQEFLLDGEVVTMLVTDDLYHIEDDTEKALVGILNKEWEEIPNLLCWEVSR